MEWKLNAFSTVHGRRQKNNTFKMSKHKVLITGPPGVGKTTLVKNVCKELSRRHLLATGFYTEENRQNGQRTGFDVLSLSGERGPLARVCGSNSPSYRVGKYSVDLKSFENIGLAQLTQAIDQNSVIVIDEIGKMELFSKPFQQVVQELFSNEQNSILATIPVPTSKPLPLVDGLRSRSDVQLYNVTRDNRNDLVNTIVKLFTNE